MGGAMGQQLIQMLAKLRNPAAAAGGPPGAPAPGGPGGPGGPNPSDISGDVLSKQFSELRGADPNFMQSALSDLKKEAVSMYGRIVSVYSRAAFQVPDVAQNVSKAQKAMGDFIKAIDAATKAAQQAQSTMQAVTPQITNRAAMPNPAGVETGGMGGVAPGGM